MTMLLEWIATSTFLILVVLALRAVLKKRISASLRYALWAVVLFRLLVPVQLFTSPVAGTVIFQETRTQITRESRSEQPEKTILPEMPKGTNSGQQTVPVLSIPKEFPDPPRFPDPPDAPAPTAELLTALDWIWLGGGIALTLAFLLSNLNFALRLRRVRIPITGTDCPLPAYVALGLPSPCLFGLLRPAVYVTPETAADPAMLRHVLTHELTHYRHGDHIWNVLRCAALAIHWWNPLVWLAVSLSRRDGELACDEGALKRLGDGERAAYGRTLLSLVTAKPRPGDLLCCATTMAGDKKSLRERVERIAKAPRRLLAAAVAAVLLLGLASACAFGRAAEPDQNTFPLPVREHSAAGGAGDYYAIQPDGTLTMWGTTENGSATALYDTPLELMGHAAAVYAGPRSAVLVIDSDGTLWSINTALFSGEDFDEDHPMTPYRVMDEVSMAAVGAYHALILKQDGTLWTAGFGGFGAPWSEGEVPTGYFTQVMDNVIDVGLSSHGGYAVTADHELWAWGETTESEGTVKVMDGVSRAEYGFVLTTGGDLLHWDFIDINGTRSAMQKVLSDVVYLENGLVIQSDGTLSIWSESEEQFLKLRTGVRCASRGEDGVVMTLEDGSTWFDGDVYTLLNTGTGMEHFAVDVTGVPGDVLSMASFYAEGQYERCKENVWTFCVDDNGSLLDPGPIEFDDWRIDYFEGPWQNTVDGTELEVWRINYELHTTQPERANLAIVGGMYLTEDGWFCPTYPTCTYLLFTKSGDSGWQFTDAYIINSTGPDGEDFWDRFITTPEPEWTKDGGMVLPYAPDLNRNGKPETIRLKDQEADGIVSEQRLEIWEDDTDELLYVDYAGYAHGGWNAYFLCKLDGQDYLLWYNPFMGQGYGTYNYKLLTLEGGEAKAVQENYVQFSINFAPNTDYDFDPKAIASFMDEVNELLAHSEILVCTDTDLMSTFDKNDRLYDDLWWLDFFPEVYTRNPDRDLLGNLEDFLAAWEAYNSNLPDEPELYFPAEVGDDMILSYHGKSVQFQGVRNDENQAKNHQPQVLDLNGDGKDEIVFHLEVGRGTGVLEETLYLFDAETLTRYDTNVLGEVIGQIESTSDEENFYLSAPGMGQVTIPKSDIQDDNLFNTIQFGNYYSYVIDPFRKGISCVVSGQGSVTQFCAQLRAELIFTGTGVEVGTYEFLGS